MKTKVINTENGEFINDFATLELANEFIASEKLEDADLELIAVPVMYVIADGSGDFPNGMTKMKLDLVAIFQMLQLLQLNN